MSQIPPTGTSSPNFETIFAAALEAYKKKTKKDIASHPLATQLQSCDSSSAILTVLRAQVQANDQAQSADEKWTAWLYPTVDVVSAFSAVLNVAGPVFPPATAIFTGIGILLQAITDVRADRDALTDLFDRMESFFMRLEKYIHFRPTAAMTDIIVKTMIEVIAILGIVTKEIKQGRTKKFLKKLAGRKDVEDAFRRLDRLTPEEALMAAAETMTVTRAINDIVKDVDKRLGSVDERVHRIDMNTDGIEDKVHGIDRKVQAADERVIQGVKETGVAIQQVFNQVNNLNRNELRKDLRKWIAPPDPSINLNTASDAHHKGTAAWCTEGNTVITWKASGSLLWIHGKPGSGKSILSSAIIHHIKPMCEAGSAVLAYFYFDFKDTEKQDSRALLSSLLVQLSNESDQFCDVLHGLYLENKDGSQQPDTASLYRCLKGMLTIAGSRPVYLVMDALDECPNDSGIPSSREKVLETVKELVELRNPNLRLCVTSRPEYDIRTTLEPLAMQQVSLHDECGQKQDINDYITSVVHSDGKMKKWRDAEKDMVIKKLTAKADGMFRWVFCQLEVLRHCFPSDLLRILEELPKSLDDTYKRILKEINNANQVHAYRLLQCLTVASRPLRVEELAEVLAFDLGTGGIPKLNANWRWENQEEAVLSACSSLVSVVVQDGSRVVQFSHFSVKEFLTSDCLTTCIEVPQFHIPLEPSHVIFVQIPLYQYATEYWVGHAQIGNVELAIKDTLDRFFDMDRPHFSTWVRREYSYELLTGSADEDADVPPSAAPLYFAAWRGFRSLVERLLFKHPEQVHQFGGRFGPPLHASVHGGHIEVAQFLFAHGADINSRSALNVTPLHIASEMGHLKIVEWLLNLGADVNSEEARGHIPLHFSAGSGHLEVCRMLIEYGAVVNTRGHTGSTPFLEACQWGHTDIIWLLLDHNPDVNVRDSDDWEDTPLHYAAGRGLLKLVQKLLELKAEVNSCDRLKSTPLLLSSRYGHTDVVRLLLDHNADAYAHDSHGDTSLHEAAGRSHLEISQMLLEHGAEVNSRNNDGWTPLLWVSGYRDGGNLDVVRILLDHGADVQLRNRDGKTASELAFDLERHEIVRLLSQHAA
ncbi:Ankyrin repeat-containing domain protein [Lactarius tabidus]